jgi:hypothetical protein
MQVKELIEKLLKEDPDAEVWMEDAGEGMYGSDLTGCMGYDYAEAEDVRAVKEGVLITKY